MGVLAIVLSLAVFAGLTGATYNSRVSPPPLNSFVTCFEAFTLSNGMSIPFERFPPPLIPLQQTPQEYLPRTDFVYPGDLWLPAPSGWDAPPGKLTESSALIHLGNAFDSQLTTTSLPPLSPDVGSLPGYQPLPEVVPGQIPDPPSNAASIILEWLNLNNLGDFNCPLRGVWADLGPNYYPRFMASFYCQDSSCSFATETGCHPDLSRSDASTSPYNVTLLRWDCCSSFNPSALNNYENLCGWVKVRVPIIRSCVCGCGPKLT